MYIYIRAIHVGQPHSQAIHGLGMKLLVGVYHTSKIVSMEEQAIASTNK